MKDNIIVMVGGQEVEINSRVAEAYIKVCTSIVPSEDNIINEVQRVADYDTHEDKPAVDRDSLMAILVGRIEHQFNKLEAERNA